MRALVSLGQQFTMISAPGTPSKAGLWLPALAPLSILIAAGTGFALVVVAGLWLLTEQPWLGLNWRLDDLDRVAIAGVAAGGPAEGHITEGDVVGAVEDAAGERVGLTVQSILREPDNLATYSQYNRFFERQRELDRVLAHPPVSLLLANGQAVTLSPAPSRPIRDLPFGYWAINLVAAVGLLFGIGVWSYRRGQPAARLLAVGSIGFMFQGCCMAIYTSRELALDPRLFSALTATNHLGGTLFAYSALALLWYYPSRIGPLPFATFTYGAAALVWLNETLQVVQWPGHTFYLVPFVLPYVLGLYLARRQWLLSHGRPVERASLRWFLLTIFVSIGSVLVLYFGPTLLGEPPLLPLWIAQFLLLSLYGGLAAGVLRYRLFDVERWWFATWVWFLGGLLVVGIDLLLIYLMNLHPLGALSVAILIMAWIYFPARQWLWAHLFRSPTQQLEHYLPELMETYFSTTTLSDFECQWTSLLKRIFDPLSARTLASPADDAGLEEYGLTLRVPSIGDGQCIALTGRNHGNKLFTSADLELARALLALGRKSANLRRDQQQGIRAERNRIMRDLHDDVGARLLTLIHRAKQDEDAEMARSALKALRETIHTLDDDARVPLRTALEDWKLEIQDRLEAAGVELAWTEDHGATEFILPPRQRINLGRIIREGLSNALRHGPPASVAIHTMVDESRLELAIADDNRSAPIAEWEEGTGMTNMRTRAKEIGADIHWHQAEPGSAATGTTLRLTLPLHEDIGDAVDTAG